MRVAALIAILAFAAIADASRVNVLGLRSILSDEKEEKEPMYCKDHEKHSDCPEYYECVALEETFCKSRPDCKTDYHGKQTCTYVKDCWDYHCVEVPRYCDPYAKYDECEKEYGYAWQCKELDERVCTYKDKCTPYRTDKCKEYEYEDKCHYVNDGCKEYAKKKECKFRDVCIKYKQEKKCDKKQVCKDYKKITTCVQKCVGYDAYGRCNKHDNDCTTKPGPCKDHEYKEVNCRYEDTNTCIQYKKVEHDCKYVDTHCKVYNKRKVCEKFKKGCKAYEYKDRCEKVEDVCWKGKCVKKPPPPPPPPSPKYYGSQYTG